MTDRNYTIKEITDFVLFLEEKYKLLEWKIDDVFVWQSARVTVYVKICELLNIQPVYPKKLSLNTKIKLFYQRAIINSIFYNPFFDFTNSKILVFESGKKYFNNGKYIDIYTAYLCEDLKKSDITYKKYEGDYRFDVLNKNKDHTKHQDFIFLFSKIISKFIKPNISRGNIDRIINIENELNDAFKFKINLKQIFIKEIKRFKSQYPFYKALFKIKNSEEVYLVNSCFKAPLIKAAKDCHIIVSELQHGLMAKEDLIEHFPNTKEDSLEYFPDKFYVWKDIDMFTSKLPISNSNILYFENMHLKYIKNNLKNIQRKADQILVVSQPELSNEILQFILENIDEMAEFEFVYKMHPTEETIFYNNQKANSLVLFNNVTIVDNKKSIYELFLESKYVVGVYSAAIFEAAYFGCEILLLNLPGSETAYTLLDRKKTILIDTNDKLLQFIL